MTGLSLFYFFLPFKILTETSPRWPVIAIIVIGGLFIASIIWCIVRCACCGLSCCCECCYCLKCCGECCGCCDPPRGRKNKYLDEPYIPPHHGEHGYKSQEPMNFGARPAASNYASPRSVEPPQYAEFDSGGKKGGEDSLPAMPTWETANSKKVLVDGEEVEMDQLNKPAGTGAVGANGQQMPLMTGASGTPGPASPIRSPDLTTSPYGPPGGHGNAGGYLAAGGAGGDPYAMDSHDAYDQRASPHGSDHGYGVAGGAMAAGAMVGGRRSPRDYNNGGYGQDRGHGYPGQGEFDDRSRQNNPYDDPHQYDDYGGHQANGFGMAGAGGRNSPAPRGVPNMRDPYGGARMSPAPGGARMSPGPGGARRSPAPRGDFGRNGSFGDNTSYRAPQPLRQPPQRQFSHDVPPSPTSLRNNSGFDFNSGYSRRGSPGTQSPQPQQQQQQASAYPGYRAYQPNQEKQENWSGL